MKHKKLIVVICLLLLLSTSAFAVTRSFYNLYVPGNGGHSYTYGYEKNETGRSGWIKITKSTADSNSLQAELYNNTKGIRGPKRDANVGNVVTLPAYNSFKSGHTVSVRINSYWLAGEQTASGNFDVK